MRFLKSIRDLPTRASTWRWPFQTLRKANISTAERELFERYGENVIAMQVAGSFDQDVEHARDWLTERTRSRQRRESITFALEIVVVLLIGGEIFLALWQGHLQSLNFDEQQQVLKNLQNSSATTAKTLASLQSATESMNTVLQMQLDAARKSEAQAERSAKAGEASASTASQALHISERAYVHVDAGVTSTPKVGERLGFQANFTNAGRTPALDVVTRVRSGLDPASDTAEHARSVAFGPSVPIAYTSKGIISAGGKAQTTWQSEAPLSQAELDGLTTHQTRLYVFADVTYKDEFNRPHQTNFCAFLDPTTNTLLVCSSLNDAN
ncbi:MAG: hypothetical protein WA517_01660 [Candidatus Acidiferrum sp.]